MKQGIPLTYLGMSVGDVEQKDTGLEIVQNLFKAIQGEAVNPRHVEHKEGEMGTGEHIKPRTQVQRQSLSTQWLTGAGNSSSTEGARRDQTAWGWQTLCCQ